MRKRWKGVLITCGILAVLGAGMCVSAAAIGIDRSEIPSDFFPYVRWLHENDTEHHEKTGDTVYFKSFSGIQSLDIWAEAMKVEVKTSTDQSGQIRIDTRDVDTESELEVKKDGTKLVVRSEKERNNHWQDDSDATVIITVPKKIEFDKVKGYAGAGSIWFEEIRCEKLDLDVGAGAVEADTFSAGKIEIECDAGSVELSRGNSPSDTDVSCNAGGITLELSGDRSEYDYKMKASAGDISIDGESVASGLQENYDQDHGTGKKIKADCMAGSIEIVFK